MTLWFLINPDTDPTLKDQFIAYGPVSVFVLCKGERITKKSGGRFKKPLENNTNIFLALNRCDLYICSRKTTGWKKFFDILNNCVVAASKKRPLFSGENRQIGRFWHAKVLWHSELQIYLSETYLAEPNLACQGIAQAFSGLFSALVFTRIPLKQGLRLFKNFVKCSKVSVSSETYFH